jgi:hypothetical protein
MKFTVFQGTFRIGRQVFIANQWGEIGRRQDRAYEGVHLDCEFVGRHLMKQIRRILASGRPERCLEIKILGGEITEKRRKIMGRRIPIKL